MIWLDHLKANRDALTDFDDFMNAVETECHQQFMRGKDMAEIQEARGVMRLVQRIRHAINFREQEDKQYAEYRRDAGLDQPESESRSPESGWKSA